LLILLIRLYNKHYHHRQKHKNYKQQCREDKHIERIEVDSTDAFTTPSTMVVVVCKIKYSIFIDYTTYLRCIFRNHDSATRSSFHVLLYYILCISCIRFVLSSLIPVPLLSHSLLCGDSSKGLLDLSILLENGLLLELDTHLSRDSRMYLAVQGTQTMPVSSRIN